MKYDDIINEYNLKKKKCRYKSYFYARRKYELYLEQLDRAEEDRRLIERYKNELQYI